ncbi:MAG: hypothetical protein ACW96U_12320 [Candidatus Heimdallarchaeaceae archaeon]|jgi:hypothetical protein
MKSSTINKYLFVITAIMLILCINPSQAAVKSRSIKDENGMEISITCETNSSIVSRDFGINLTLDFSKQPDNVVKLFRIEMGIRLLDTNSTERTKQTVKFADLYPNETQKKSTTVEFSNEWGRVRLELKLYYFVDYTESSPSLAYTTDWISFLTLKKAGSFASNYDWVFTILGSVTFIGIGLLFYYKFLKT